MRRSGLSPRRPPLAHAYAPAGDRAARPAAAGIRRDDTPVLAIQNGLGSAEKVAGILGAARIIQGVVGGFGASMKGPGHAHHNGMEFVRLGEYAGPKTARLEQVAEVWRSGGFKVLTFDDIHKMVWEKLICNVAFSGPCTLTGLTIGQVRADANAWGIASACATEAHTVPRATGSAPVIHHPVPSPSAFPAQIPIPPRQGQPAR